MLTVKECYMSEDLMIIHCSPTMAGLKTANMFTDDFSSAGELRAYIFRINSILQPKGARVIPLKYKNGKALLYMYRPSKLSSDLKDPGAARILRKYGYDPSDADQCITRLIGRINTQSGFPHEIGLFLGYPPCDVEGFINNKAQNCKIVGTWKVYGDVSLAEKAFAGFRKCTDIYCRHWNEHKNFGKLVVATP